MEENLLQNPINVFFSRIVELQGTLSHVESILLKDLKFIKSKELESSGLRFLRGRHLIIKDITELHVNGGFPYATGFTKVLKVENYQKEIDFLIKRESAFMIAQAYEAFETFIKDIIAIYLFLNKDLAKQTSEKFLDSMNLKEFKSTIREVDKFKGTNNVEYFKFIRRHSVNFKNFEINNNSGINIREWYEIYSKVRHAIVHSNGLVIEQNVKGWSKDKLGLFRESFPYNKNETSYKLEITSSSALKALNTIPELAFLIFKCLSIEANLDWKILLHMNKE